MRVCDYCVAPESVQVILTSLELPVLIDANEITTRKVELCKKCLRKVAEATDHIQAGINERRRILRGDNK